MMRFFHGRARVRGLRVAFKVKFSADTKCFNFMKKYYFKGRQTSLRHTIAHFVHFVVNISAIQLLLQILMVPIKICIAII